MGSTGRGEDKEEDTEKQGQSEGGGCVRREGGRECKKVGVGVGVD